MSRATAPGKGNPSPATAVLLPAPNRGQSPERPAAQARHIVVTPVDPGVRSGRGTVGRWHARTASSSTGRTTTSGNRGVAKATVFHSDEDRHQFIAMLAGVIDEHGWICSSYCLMKNHYHLTLTTPEPNLGAGMGRLSQLYAQWFNRRHDRVGHLFQQRYWSQVIAHRRRAFRGRPLHPGQPCSSRHLQPTRAMAVVKRAGHGRSRAVAEVPRPEPAGPRLSPCHKSAPGLAQQHSGD